MGSIPVAGAKITVVLLTSPTVVFVFADTVQIPVTSPTVIFVILQ